MEIRVRAEEDAGADEVDGREGVDAVGEVEPEVGADADADDDGAETTRTGEVFAGGWGGTIEDERGGGLVEF